VKKTWQEKLNDRPSFPEVLRLEKGFPSYYAAHEIRLTWRLCAQPRTLLCLYKR
jgi:hypothetical protein